jgi:hypothetical protein
MIDRLVHHADILALKGETATASKTATSHDQLRRLRREVKTLIEERKILKKSRPSSPGKAGPGERLQVHRDGEGRARDEGDVPRARCLALRLSRVGLSLSRPPG